MADSSPEMGRSSRHTGLRIDSCKVVCGVAEIEKVPIHLKAALTIREAAEYSNIGINKIDRMLRMPNCPFVLYVGAKKLVKRKEFEQFISNNLRI